MKRLTVEIERKYGLVPNGRPSNNISIKLLKGLLKDYRVEYIHQTQERYLLQGIENGKCQLREIKQNEISDIINTEFTPFDLVYNHACYCGTIFVE